jgi:iron complex transport system ATP-binding protein
VSSVVAQGRYSYRRGLSGRSAADERVIDEAMQIADVAAFAERPFTELSFGEQRRVLLARGLATEAPLLCLDEPTASLDIGHALALYDLLRQLAGRGRAVVLVLHQLADALRFTDHALLLCEGRSVARGPTPEVLVEEHVRAVYGVAMRQEASPTFSLP